MLTELVTGAAPNSLSSSTKKNRKKVIILGIKLNVEVKKINFINFLSVTNCLSL